MNGGNPELNVELRLLLSKIQGDAARAGAIVKKAITGETSELTKSSGIVARQIRLFDVWGKTRIKAGLDAAKAMKWYESAVRRATLAEQKMGIAKPQSAQETELEAWRKKNAGGVAPDMKIVGEGFSDTLSKAETAVEQFTEALTNTGKGIASAPPDLQAEEKAQAIKEQREKAVKREAELARMADAKSADDKRKAAAALRGENDVLKFRKDLSLLSLPLLKPTSVFGTAFASRAVAQGLLGTETGRASMARFGLKGAGGATAATAALVGAATALGLAFKALSAAVNGAMAAYEKQARIYAKSLSSGLSIGFVQRRTILADIMGVSEEEVVRFGKAMEYLNPKIAIASKALAQSTVPLTQVQWAFKVLGYDMEALFARIAQGAAPALVKFANGIDLVVKAIVSAGDFLVRFGQEGIKFFSEQILQNLFGALGGKVAGALFGKVSDLFSKIGTASSPNMPAPQSYMKQLGASSLERMGLVMGMGGGNNPNHETAKNTKRMVQVLEFIARQTSTHGTLSPLQSYR